MFVCKGVANRENRIVAVREGQLVYPAQFAEALKERFGKTSIWKTIKTYLKKSYHVGIGEYLYNMNPDPQTPQEQEYLFGNTSMSIELPKDTDPIRKQAMFLLREYRRLVNEFDISPEYKKYIGRK